MKDRTGLRESLKFLIIGGSDAGISAALRARELDAGAAITVLLADGYPNFSICGLPFFLSGETPDWHSLAHRTEFEGIELLTWHTATAIDPDQKSVDVIDREHRTKSLSYDRLLVATGAMPLLPEIPGIDLPGVYCLHTMDDSFGVQSRLEANPRSAIIVGAGYIGVEMADALVQRGLQVTLVGKTGSVLATVDRELGDIIGDELRRNNVDVKTNVEVTGIESSSGLRVSGTNGFEQSADLVLVATGVKPASHLAVEAGIKTGHKGAIGADTSMRTNIPDIYTAGDCVETWHRVLQQYKYLPLGTTSHKQGRVAGENAVGGSRLFAGSVGTQVVKVFDLAAARTGLREHEAKAAGCNAFTIETVAWDHKAYYPGAHQMRIRVTGDIDSRRLLGAQIVGHWCSEVAKRIDIFAAGLFHGMSLEDFSDLDLSYTPPLSSPWDPIQLAAQDWCKKASDRHS
jgi:NADPH-dependent 2,4-dienoyl-CoA reductase/sulfur reductase-like enzyme